MLSDIGNGIVDGFEKVSEWVTNTIFYAVTIGGVSIPLIVVWLVVAAIFFTIYMGFENVRGFKMSFDVVRGKYSGPDSAGEVSHFQALSTAVSGTVGLGNIGGVAIAISLGGPGATFWMILAGFLGMSTKLVECTLGVKYRVTHEDGSVSGGPMYYLRDGVGSLYSKPLGKFLAAFFAVCAIGGAIGGGNMFQANQATTQLVNVAGGEDGAIADYRWLIGVIFAVLVGAVIIGGIKSIARVTEKIVPAMAILYITACIIVILVSIADVPSAIGQIITGAFSYEGVAGGFVGVLIVGFQRAAFSNEAGIGSASIAHSAVKTDEPATEGFVALLEPFIDTIVICTMTALAIVVTGVYQADDATEVEGVSLTSRAFESVLPWFPNVLAVAVLFFAFSTMISWSYYGMKATGYLFGDSAVAENVFKVIFCIFTVIGATASLGPVINFSDSAIFAMSLANVTGLYLLARVVKKEVSHFRSRISDGTIETFPTASLTRFGR